MNRHERGAQLLGSENLSHLPYQEQYSERSYLESAQILESQLRSGAANFSDLLGKYLRRQ